MASRNVEYRENFFLDVSLILRTILAISARIMGYEWTPLAWIKNTNTNWKVEWYGFVATTQSVLKKDRTAK